MGGKVDKALFMNVTERSLEESRNYLFLPMDLGYGQSCEPINSLEEASRVPHAYRQAAIASGIRLPHPGFTKRQ